MCNQAIRCPSKSGRCSQSRCSRVTTSLGGFIVIDAFQTKKAWVKYIHQKNWGGVRARIELRMGAQGSEEVSEAQVREAFDEGEEVSLV